VTKAATATMVPREAVPQQRSRPCALRTETHLLRRKIRGPVVKRRIRWIYAGLKKRPRNPFM
jgi:hypothetical protein